MDGITGLDFVRRIEDIAVPVILMTGDRHELDG